MDRNAVPTANPQTRLARAWRGELRLADTGFRQIASEQASNVNKTILRYRRGIFAPSREKGIVPGGHSPLRQLHQGDHDRRDLAMLPSRMNPDWIAVHSCVIRESSVKG